MSLCGSPGVLGESLVEFDDADGNTHTYLKRTKHMVSKIIEGKMMTYAETTMAEYVQDSHPTKGNGGRDASPSRFRLVRRTHNAPPRGTHVWRTYRNL